MFLPELYVILFNLSTMKLYYSELYDFHFLSLNIDEYQIC